MDGSLTRQGPFHQPPVNGTKYQNSSLTSRHEPLKGVQIHSHISIQTLQKGNSFKKNKTLTRYS